MVPTLSADGYPVCRPIDVGLKGKSKGFGNGMSKHKGLWQSGLCWQRLCNGRPWAVCDAGVMRFC